MVSAAGEKQTLNALLVANLVLGALTAAIAAGFLYFHFLYEPSADPQQMQPYLAEAQERLEQHTDEIAAEAATLAEEIGPPIGDAIYVQVREDYPAYMRALKTQGREYLDNVETIFIDQVKAQYGDYLRAHRNVVKQEFPEHASDENVEAFLQDVEEVIDRIVQRYYIDEFRREAARTTALWERFEPLEIPGPNEPSLQEQLADYTADWAVLAVSATVEQGSAGQPSQPISTSASLSDSPAQE